MESNIENSFLTKQEQLLFIKISLLLGIDLLFAALGITFLTAREIIISSFIPLLSMVFLFLLVSFLRFVKKQRMSPLLLNSVFLLLFVIGIYLFSLEWWILVIMFLFLHWRTSSYFREEEISIDISSGIILGFIFASSLSLIFGNARDLQNDYIIYTLDIIFFSFISIVTSIQRMMHSQTVSNEKSKQYFVKPFLFLFIAFICGGILAYLSVFVREGFYWILEKIFWSFSLIVNPIFELLIIIRDWILSHISKDALKGIGTKITKQDVDPLQQNAIHEGISFPWFNVLLVTILIVGVIIYLLKKRNDSFVLEGKEVTNPIISTFKMKKSIDERDKLHTHYSKGKDEIRKLMHQLEEEAFKSGFERKISENLRGWFSRIGFQEEEKFFELYESVRYGTKIPSNYEVDYFTLRVKTFKQFIHEKNNNI